MKILWIPQISSKSKSDTILLTDDSNISVLMNMKDSNFFKENEITVALEFSRCNCIGINWLEESGLKVWSDESRMFTNAKLERYNFNVHFYEKLNKQNYDIVFVNEPTKVLALKEIFVNSKIVTYNHWMACKNMKNLIIRQFEGMSAADICFLNSNYAKYEILNFYEKYEGVEKMNLIKLQPSFNMKVKGLKNEARCNIVYNHRLSTDPYYMKAFNSLIKVCDIIEKEIGVKNMPTIYFTNPSGKEFNVLNFKPYFAEITLEEKSDYNNFISSKEIGIHLNTFFDSEGMWSMSTVDCAASGNICLIPRKYGYAEIFDKEYAGYCDTEMEMASILTSILKRSTKEEWGNIAKDFDVSSIKNHNGNVLGNKLQNVLQNYIKENSNDNK